MQQKAVGRAGLAALLRLGAAAGYLALVHAAALVGQPRLGLYGLIGFFLVNLGAALIKGSRGRELTFWLVCGVATVAAVELMTDAVLVVYLSPILVYLFLFLVFGSTLLPGREPLITRVYRFDQGDVIPLVVPYTRALTLVWTLLFALLAAVSLVLMAYLDLRIWSWVANIAGPSLSVLLFLGEHAVRPTRYGRTSPLRTLRTMMRPGVWAPH